MKIILIDDHHLFLEGFSILVKEKLSTTTIVSCDNAGEALRRIENEHFDLCITDLYMPGISGLKLIQQLKTSHPSLVVLIISQSENPRDISESLYHGAAGYLNKKSKSAEVVNAINSVLSGTKYLSANTKKLLKEFEQHERQLHITQKQQEVLRLLAKGLNNNDIALELAIKEVTVKTHVSDLLGIFQVKNRVECVLKAKALSIV